MLRPLSHLQAVTPAAVNKLIDVMNALQSMSVAPPLELTRPGGRPMLRLSEAGFQAEVTAITDVSGEHNYTVAEVQPDAAGAWSLVTGGREVTATEWNNAVLATGTVVWVEPVDNDDWRCYSGGGGMVGPTIHVFRYACGDGNNLLETVYTVRLDATGASVTTDSSCSFTISISGLAVTFTASANPGPAPVTYSWDFGDSSSGSGSPVSHIYAAAGTYTVVLTATYGDGYVVTHTAGVTV